MIPLAAAGIVVTASTGCDYSGTTAANSVPITTDHSAADGKPALNAVRAFDLGELVVDGAGYALYRYDEDATMPPKSACDTTCTRQWKPVPGAAAQNLHGVEPALVGTMTRADGTDQVTLAGWPLYRCVADEMPGETAGRGMAGAWFPVTPQGAKVVTAADPGQSDAFGL
ncbi:hypothetical protein HFP15_28690 [Amycolatopsis sp. K13G38]|uniref:Lipoprotein n=2 Tax=Amycolatopsis acididurans TaxID=2724524 RepID=A0ABX1JAS0_9PSEU|nr:hypothetical protein [Amycolatopsis acididurans]